MVQRDISDLLTQTVTYKYLLIYLLTYHMQVLSVRSSQQAVSIVHHSTKAIQNNTTVNLNTVCTVKSYHVNGRNYRSNYRAVKQ